MLELSRLSGPRETGCKTHVESTYFTNVHFIVIFMQLTIIKCEGGSPGAAPIKILQRKFYSMLFLTVLNSYSNISTNQNAQKLA